MRRARSGVLAVLLLSLWGCAAAPPQRPSARPFDDVRRLAIVASGESSLSVVGHNAQPGRTFDEIMTWYPTKPWLRPLAKLLHQSINWALEFDQTATVARSVEGISPRTVVAAAMAQKLRASGWFEEIRTFEREQSAEDRRRDDAIVRVMVPAWGVVRVRDGEPDLLAGFADVRGHMMRSGTGVIMWEENQDVTSPEQFPLAMFMKDQDFARQEMVDVLERAGQRLANELMYALGAGR
jgi:hypothetical protein